MVSGVAFQPDHETLIQSIKNNHGKITRIAKDFSVQGPTVRKYINEHEELKEALQSARGIYIEIACDLAEDTLIFAMKKRDIDLGNALKAAFYVLNNQGKDRGYAHILSDKIIDINVASQFNQLMKQVSNVQQSSERIMEDINISAEQKS